MAVMSCAQRRFGALGLVDERPLATSNVCVSFVVMLVTSDHSPCSWTTATDFLPSVTSVAVDWYASTLEAGFSTFRIGATRSRNVVLGIKSVMMHL